MGKATIRVPMPIKMRAKQFAMFDALKGLREAIAEKEKQSSQKKELSESRIDEINTQLTLLCVGDFVAVEYYCSYGKKYRKIEGKLVKIDVFWRELQINRTVIGFSEIENINS